MILVLLAAPLKVTAAEQNGESSDKQQNETTKQKTEETEETAPEMTTDLGLAAYPKGPFGLFRQAVCKSVK